jgi:transposase InsO family protein
MLNSLEFFTESQPVHIFIITGDGKSRKELVATKKGTAMIRVADNKIITFQDVLYVPNLTRNLISFSKLIQNKILIQHSGSSYEVISNDQEKLFSLDLSGELFEINGNILPLHQEAIAMLKISEDATGFAKWHNRLGHAITKRLKAVLPKHEHLIKDGCCHACMKGELTRQSFKHHFDQVSAPLEVVHGDLVGPITPSSNGGARYFLTLVNQYTSFINVTILKEKSDTPMAIQNFKVFYEKQTGHNLKKLITDGGGEFCNNNLSKILSENGIQHNISPPYTPQLNGIAERANCTVLDMTRCIMLHSNVALEWWADAVKTATAITNYLPSLSQSLSSPLALLFKKKPNIKFFRPFGCKVWSLKPEIYHKTKFDLIAWEGVLIGYSNDYSTYKVVQLNNKQIINVKHAYFEEDVYPLCSALHKSLDNLNCSNDVPTF